MLNAAVLIVVGFYFGAEHQKINETNPKNETDI